jgi:hypothetical protein
MKSWTCDRCGFEVWAGSKTEVRERAKEHLFEAHRHPDEGETGADFEAVLAEKGNALVLGEHGSATVRRVCLKLLTPFELAETTVVWVTNDPGRRLETWLDAVGAWPDELVVVAPGDPEVGERVRTAVTAPEAPVALESVGRADLGELGVTVAEQLEGTADAETTVVLGFDSISGLLRSFEVKDVFRFVHTLESHVRRVDAVGHYHLDPRAHDEPTVNVFRSAFEVVVETADGEVSVVVDD